MNAIEKRFNKSSKFSALIDSRSTFSPEKNSFCFLHLGQIVSRDGKIRLEPHIKTVRHYYRKSKYSITRKWPSRVNSVIEYLFNMLIDVKRAI